MSDDNRVTTGESGLNESIKSQFSRRADLYKTSTVHAAGEDLQWMTTEASLTGQERVLDLATGAGHTAFAFANAARTVTGLDLTAKMVENATELALERNLVNVQFVLGNAAKLPFPDAYFDVVTCRFAAHHFSSPGEAIRESARVLKPRGRLLLVDHVAPPEPELDKFINRLDWLRDSSHVREWTIAEWTEYFRKAGLTMKVPNRWDLHMNVDIWIQRADPAEERIEEIYEMFENADGDTRRTFSLKYDSDGTPESFALKCALMAGDKV